MKLFTDKSTKVPFQACPICMKVCSFLDKRKKCKHLISIEVLKSGKFKFRYSEYI